VLLVVMNSSHGGWAWEFSIGTTSAHLRTGLVLRPGKAHHSGADCVGVVT
jgi:hypothetical protein